MKKLILSLFFAAITSQAATSFTEFFCNSTGTNINAGSTTNAAATFSDANGNWDAATGIFICSGVSDLSAVAAGDWASVFVDGATTAVFVGRVTDVVDATDTITVSVAIKTGTPPSTSATGRSIKVGGAWFGPWHVAGASVDNLPFNFVNNLLTNINQNSTRINFRNDRIYSTTNVVHSSNGPTRFQGHTLTPGDGGMTWLTGSPVGAGHSAFTFSGANCDWEGFVFATNGTTISSTLVTLSGAESSMTRCVFRDARGIGVFVSGSVNIITECEAFLCNAGNSTAGAFQIASGSGGVAIRCIAHDNAGTGSSGFFVSGQGMILDCIAESNGRDGATFTGTLIGIARGSDFFNNTSNGINFTASSAISVQLENCNLIDNGAYGINSSGSFLRNGSVLNCAFGSGTAANGSGTIISGTGLNEIGSITYAANVTPWVDPGNGDFRINLAAAINSGRGLYLQTGAGGTISYPDIGSAQATNVAGGAATVVGYPMFRR